MPSARRATVSVASRASASRPRWIFDGRDHIGAERASEVTGVSEFMISCVSTRTRSACAATSSAPSSLCTGRIERIVTRLIEPRDLGRGEDRLLRDAVDHQPGDLARPGRQLSRGREFRPQIVEIVDPRELVPGEQAAALPC